VNELYPEIRGFSPLNWIILVCSCNCILYTRSRTSNLHSLLIVDLLSTLSFSGASVAWHSNGPGHGVPYGIPTSYISAAICLGLALQRFERWSHHAEFWRILCDAGPTPSLKYMETSYLNCRLWMSLMTSRKISCITTDILGFWAITLACPTSLTASK
jgi:hypothetical protein